MLRSLRMFGFHIICVIVLVPSVVCYCNGTTDPVIDLSYRGITELNGTIFKDCNPRATTVNLTGNQINSINADAFAINDGNGNYYQSFSNLQTLILDINVINKIDGEAFKYVKNSLSTLSLKNNNLTLLDAGLFKHLKHTLASFYVSNNKISSVNESVFTEDFSSLKYVDMSFNALTFCEAWPYIAPNIITFNLSFNHIDQFTNELKWVYNLKEPYNTMVDLRNNSFTIWNDEWFRQYQKPGGDFIGDFVTFGMDLSKNDWVCDCHIHYITSKIQDSFYKYAESELLRVYCKNPPNLRGQRIIDVDLNELVCDVKVDCPIGCTCTNMSETKNLRINCKGGIMTELPKKLPDIPDRTIELDVSHNKIREIGPRPYVNKISVLRADRNNLVFIDAETIRNMTQSKLTVNISHNNLQFLPKSIQNIQTISIHDNPFECDCNMTWMSGWLSLDSINADDKAVTCSYHDEVHKIVDVTESLLDCNYNTEIGLAVGFGALLVVVIIGIIWAKRCPYETKVLIFKFFRYHPSDKYKIDKEVKEHDVYISFDDENIHIRQWVLRKLKKKLEDKKLKTFIPVIDLGPGQEKADQIVEALERSKRVIVILSDKYDENEWCIFECQQAEMLNPNEGRVIFIKYHPEADDMIQNEPWKSRVKERKVFAIGEKSSEHRWFWDKLRYEMPIK